MDFIAAIYMIFFAYDLMNYKIYRILFVQVLSVIPNKLSRLNNEPIKTFEIKRLIRTYY